MNNKCLMCGADLPYDPHGEDLLCEKCGEEEIIRKLQPMDNIMTFRYNPETGSLEEISRLINNKWENSLRIIPTDYKEWSAKLLVEGVDFEVKEFLDKKTVGRTDGKSLAVPLSSSPRKESNQEELWNEIFDLYHSGDPDETIYAQIIDKLKSKYIITKR